MNALLGSSDATGVVEDKAVSAAGAVTLTEEEEEEEEEKEEESSFKGVLTAPGLVSGMPRCEDINLKGWSFGMAATSFSSLANGTNDLLEDDDLAS